MVIEAKRVLTIAGADEHLVVVDTFGANNGTMFHRFSAHLFAFSSHLPQRETRAERYPLASFPEETSTKVSLKDRGIRGPRRVETQLENENNLDEVLSPDNAHAYLDFNRGIYKCN